MNKKACNRSFFKYITVSQGVVHRRFIVLLFLTTYHVGFLTAAVPDSGLCQARRALLRPMAGIQSAAKKPTVLFRLPIHCCTRVYSWAWWGAGGCASR